MFSTGQLEEAQQWQEKGRGGVRFCHKINQWQPHSQQGEPLKQIFGKIWEFGPEWDEVSNHFRICG